MTHKFQKLVVVPNFFERFNLQNCVYQNFKIYRGFRKVASKKAICGVSGNGETNNNSSKAANKHAESTKAPTTDDKGKTKMPSSILGYRCTSWHWLNNAHTARIRCYLLVMGSNNALFLFFTLLYKISLCTNCHAVAL